MTAALHPNQASSLETILQTKTLLSQRLSFKYESHLEAPLQITRRGKGRKKTQPRSSKGDTAQKKASKIKQ